MITEGNDVDPHMLWHRSGSWICTGLHIWIRIQITPIKWKFAVSDSLIVITKSDFIILKHKN